MTRRLLSTNSPFERQFGYSRALIEDDFLFLSGTTGYDYATMSLPEEAGAQTRNIFRTIRQVLEEAGFAMGDIVRAQYFVTDRAYCAPVLAVCGEMLAEIRPAAGIYIVSGLLDPAMKVEIEITAKRSAR